MARAGNAKHLALGHLVVQPTRLFVDIDQPVILTGDDDERHLEAFVFSIEGICGGYHERRLCGAGTNLRWSHSHRFGKSDELLGD